MRIAAFSDIYGNLVTLDVVLEGIQTQGVDLTVNLGDIVSGPLQPCEAMDQLMALNLPTIRGSHEGQVLVGDPPRMGASDQYTFEQLRPDQLAWFVNPPVLQYIDDGVLFVHGSAQDDQAYLLESLSENRYRTATHDEVLYRAEDVDARLVLCGCTHMPCAMKLADGRFIVNPSNVGLQTCSDAYLFAHTIETGSLYARHAITAERASGWTAEFRVVEYA